MISIKGIGSIYTIINLESRKCYVGLTTDTMARMHQHLSALRRRVHKNPHLQASFNLYGESSFLFQIIDTNIPLSELPAREAYWAKLLSPQYNIATPGQASFLGRKHAPNALAKMAEASRGNKNCLGHKATDEARRNISIAHKHINKVNKKMRVKEWKLSDEVRAKMSIAKIGKPSNQKKAVKQIDFNSGVVLGVWASLLEAEQATGVKFSNISSAARGKSQTAGGYKWEFEKVKR